jgi:hypothetical protein
MQRCVENEGSLTQQRQHGVYSQLFDAHVSSNKCRRPRNGTVLHIVFDLCEHVSFHLDYRVPGVAAFLCSALERSHIDVLEHVLSRVNASVIRGLVSGGDGLLTVVKVCQFSRMK